MHGWISELTALATAVFGLPSQGGGSKREPRHLRLARSQSRSGSRQTATFAIVGPPGSGKTTLLKHPALALAASKGRIKRTPARVYLRDQTGAIGASLA